MSRYKGLAIAQLSLRNYNAQVGEALANAIDLGMPVRN
jgi:hypothetical protein